MRATGGVNRGVLKNGTFLLGKGMRVFAVVAVLAAVLGSIPLADPASAGLDENFSLTKTDNVGGKALIGEEVTYTLQATGNHASGLPLYNLSFRDVLPAGVNFVSGSPAPTEVLTDAPLAGQTTVIWSNVSDLPAASRSSVSITVDTNPDFTGGTTGSATVPVGSIITNDAEAVASLDPFAIPDYNLTTGAFTAEFDGSATASRTVSIIPFRVTKTAPGEMLRGVHGSATAGQIYTVEVRNNPDYATNTVTLVDTLHPGLEFLGCDTYYSSDNTTVADEWTGSGPVVTGSGCATTPLSVDTAGDGSTVVTWDLSNLAPNDVVTIQYLAGIPLTENRPFSSPPTAASLNQGRNLDNNTGPSTVEPDRVLGTDPELLSAPERTFDNTATATGTYTPSGASESDSDTHVVESEDLVITKSMSGALTQGTTVVTTLTISTSEYRDFTDLVVRDLMPSPLCFSGGFDTDNTPGGSDWQTNDCVGASSVQSTINGTPVNVASVRELDDGGPYGSGRFELVWDFAGARSALADLDADGTITISYTSVVREYYRGNGAQLLGEPVLAGDRVSNEAEVSGPDTSSSTRGLAADAADPDGGVDGDTTSSSIENGLPTLNKRVSAKSGPLTNGSSVTGAVCDTDYATITWVEGDPTAEIGYGPGDIVCFELAASFPVNVDFEGVQIQDILPPGYTYITSSAARVASIDTIPGTTLTESPNVITFAPSGDGNVEATGNEFRWVIAARINDNTDGEANDINANLQKLIFNDNGGLVYQLRDQATVEWTEPEVRLAKGVADVNAGPANPADFDGSLTGGSTRVEVAGGDVVGFRIDVWNEGNTDATSTEIQDVLPTGISCSEVSAISNSGTCSTDVITWTGLTITASTGGADQTPDDEDSAPITLTYDVTVPSTVDPSQDYINTAGVASYQSGTNETGQYDYYPADNIDPANAANENTDAADDQAFLDTPAPTISKLQRSAIGEAGNDQNASLLTTADEATIGEIIQYEITATIPDGTSVYNAEIRDVLPAGLSYFTGSGLFAGTVSNLQPAVTSSTGTVALTGGTIVDSSGTITYALPDPYTNAAGSGDDSVTITFYAQVNDTIGNQADPTSTLFANRGRFDWDDSGGNDRPDVLSNVTQTRVVEPNPVIVKDHTTPAGTASSPGAAITYRITVTNPTSATNVSVAHDVTIVDTVPVGATPLGTSSVPVSANGQPVPSTGITPAGSFNGVWSETNRTITWTPGSWVILDALAPAGTARFTYDAEVDDPAVASSNLLNTAALTAYSLDQDLTPTDDPNEGDARSYTDSDTDLITVPLADIAKDIEPFNAGDPSDDLATATVGEPLDYEVTITVPDGTAAYDATIFDDLPTRLELDSFGSIAVSSGCEVLNSTTGLSTGVSLVPGDIESLNPNGGDASVLAWFIGDVYSNGGCSITVAYTTHVTDIAAAGDTVTNDATLTWNDSDQVVSDSPVSLPVGFDSPSSPSWTVDSGPVSETFTVVEPQLAIDKDVADTSGAALVNPTCDTTIGNSLDADGGTANGCDTSAGAQLRYTVAVRNIGTSAAHDLTFVDTVPVGLNPLQTVGGTAVTTTGQTVTGNSGSVGTWDQTARTITWVDAGPVAPNGSVTVDYDAAVSTSDDLDRSEDLTNTADVETYFNFSTAERASLVLANPVNDDIPTYGNGTGATRGAVTPDVVTVEMHFPVLDVVKSATTGQDSSDVRLDQSFSWTVVVTNTDAVAPAFNVDLVDVLPVGWTYDATSALVTTPHNGGPTAVEPSCSADTGACNDAASLNIETLTWTDVISGSSEPLAPGATITLTFTATPQSAALTPNQATGESFTGPANGHTNNVSTIGEDATGSTTCCDPDGPGGTPPEEYSDTDSDEVFIARADIEVDKAVSPVEVDGDPVNGPYWFGSFVNYTITVNNVGPDDATNVTVSDILDPTTLEFDSVVSVDQGTFDDTTNIWTVGDISNGASLQITLRTRLVGLGTVTNIAQNSASDQYDSDSTPGNDAPPEDDQDSVTIEVVPTSLGDYVWLDLNSDGVQDGAEPGIPGVEIDITWLDPATGAPQSYTTTTAADGSYGVPLAAGLPANTDITVTVDVANSPNLVGLVPTFDRDGGLDNTSLDQIASGDQTLPSGALADLAYDFGYNGNNTQVIGDKVWWDQDNSADASNGASEYGVPNVDVTATWYGWDGVLGTADDVDFVDTTDAAGDYLFEDMPVGDYRVAVDDTDLPTGLNVQTFDLDGTATADTVTITLDPNENQLDVDFSYRGNGTIGDTVWFDHDGNEAIDTGEPGIVGVTVTLDWDGPDGIAGNGDDVTVTTTTAADGTYLFDQLPYGNYTITVDDTTLPGNMAQTYDDDGLGSAHTSASTLSAITPDDLAQDFGYRGLGSIGDTVFFDVDGVEIDGALNVGDAAIADVDVTVVWAGVDGIAGNGDDFSFTDITDVSGNYLVTDLPHGSYTVTVDVTDLPAGLTGQTYDNDGVGTANTSATTLDGTNPDDLDQDFAYTGATSGLIGDTVWFDANGDGIENSSEVGFSGVDVTLVWFGPDGLEGTGDDVTQATTTDADGNYLFDNLPEGDYRVTVDPFTLPAGLAQTFDIDGTTTADTSLVTLDSLNPSNLDQDFGYTGVGSLGDTVWLDLDASGTAIADTGEPGIPGVDVTIVWTNPQGADATYTVTTDSDGMYLWPTAPYGDFSVTVDTATLPGTMVQTFDQDGLVTADSSAVTLDAVTPDDLDQDFSYRGTGALGDTVWQDDDADGVLDVGEPLLDGITITLIYDDVVSGVTFTTTTVTAPDGTYGFDNLPGGDYTVTVDPATLPDGLVAVFDLDGTATPDTAAALLGDTAVRDNVDFGYQLQADLAIDKSHIGDFAIGTDADGTTNTWTMTVSNLGPAAAEAPIVISDTLPAGIAYLRSDGAGWDCSISGQDLACTLVDVDSNPIGLLDGESVSIDVIVEVAASTAPGVTNTATVSTPTVDPVPENDTDADPTDVPLSVLTIDKTADGDVRTGRQATYVLTSTNTGPWATRGDVVITDELPQGLTFASATSDVDAATCVHAAGVVTCTNPEVIAVDATWTVELTVGVTAGAGTSIVNIGRVDGGNEVNGENLSSQVSGVTEDTATVMVRSAGAIAFTGANAGKSIALSLALLTLGAALVFLSRRRRTVLAIVRID